MSYRCRCCNQSKMYHMDKSDGLCDKCYGAGNSTFTYSLDHEYANIKGSGYTTSDAIQGHVNKSYMMGN